MRHGLLCSSLRRLLALVLLVALGGCAATSVFRPYTYEAQQYKQSMVGGHAYSAAEALSKKTFKTHSADKLLYLMESGRLYQVADNFAASQVDFDQAIQLFTYYEEKARISASLLAANSAALLTNDNARPYRGEAYERVFLHLFQAFNYLGLNNPAAAAVELRRAALEQRSEELKHEKAIARAEARAQDERVALPNSGAIPQWQSMDALIANVKSAFQNAYSFYASAVIWEALGERNNALVDYKKALEINPDSTQLKQAIQRLDQGLVNKGLVNSGSVSEQKSTLVVLYEDGFIPERQSFILNLPDFSRKTYYSIAFPFYSPQQWYRPTALHVNGTQLSGETELIANFSAMAVKALKNNIPELLLRQILRARVKYELQAKAQEADPLAGLAATLYNIASERADLRNWLTLPNNAQVLRLEAAAGEHQLQLHNGRASTQQTIRLTAGRTTILRVFNFNHRLQTQLFQL